MVVFNHWYIPHNYITNCFSEYFVGAVFQSTSNQYCNCCNDYSRLLTFVNLHHFCQVFDATGLTLFCDLPGNLDYVTDTGVLKLEFHSDSTKNTSLVITFVFVIFSLV